MSMSARTSTSPMTPATGPMTSSWAVAADPAVLGSLEEREYRSGLAEAVKMALGLDAGFFEWLEGHAEAVAARESGAVAQVVSESVRLKAGVVAEDEQERCGRRALLNLGHTVGHGLEAGSGYALAHGEAVALGLLPVLEVSVERCGMPREEAETFAGEGTEWLVRQKTPLFLSLTKPDGAKDGCRWADRAGAAYETKLRDNLWVTTPAVARRAEPLPGATSRIDLSWD